MALPWKCVSAVFLLGVALTRQLVLSKPSRTVHSVKEFLSEIQNKTFETDDILPEDVQKASLAFVFDVTGSMHDDLRQLREGAHMILDAIIQNPKAQISNFVLVPFEDPGYGPATVTEDRELFKEALNKLELVGGGDCPEMSLSGIQEALAVSQPLSYVYVFTDASATDHFILDSILDQVQRKQSQVVFVLTGDCKDRDKPSFRAYEKIAAASSGQVFNLRKTNVHKVLQFVKSSVAGRRVNLGSVTNPAGYNYTQAVIVDKSLGDVTVSVSGSDPQIKVTDPRGKEVTGPPKLVKTLDLDAIMVVNLVNPEPGNWSITVGSREQHSVKVTGLSNLTFQYGFSVHPPVGLRDTSHRPLQGANNFLLISPTPTAGKAEIRFAEIVSTEGKLLFELPLKHLDGDEKLFLTGPFLPPDDFFYIAINGVDENMNHFRRIGATAIQPQLPDVPFLTVQQQMNAHLHEAVVLKCAIESLVPVTAQWFLGNKRLQDKISSLQSTSVEYIIQNMGPEHEGTYRCIASNVAGFSKAVTVVVLLVEPPVVTLTPGNMTVPAYSSIGVACSVQSQAPLTGFQFQIFGADGSVSVTRDIPQRVGDIYNHNINMSANNSAKYSCVATNDGGEGSKEFYMEVLKPLKANILESKPLLTRLNGSFNLTCRIENGDAVQWVDPAGEVRTQNENLQIVLYDSVFTVHEVQLEDAGKWKCVTSRGAEIVSDSIDVMLKPIVRTSESTTAIYGQDVNITCIVTGSAPANITWTNHNRETIPSNISSSENAMIHTSVLSFHNITRKYEGTYYCSCENIAGADTANVSLRTWQKQSVVNSFKDIYVDIYSSAHLTCHVQSHPPSVIRWYHNGTALNNGRREVYLSSTVDIRNMDFNKTGQYTCLASNQYETNSYNVSVGLSGLEKPQIDKSTTKVVTTEGDSIQISCRLLKGKPTPNVTWQYRRSASGEFDNFTNSVINETSVLSLTKIGVNQTGTYRCSAKNILGEDHHEVALVVQFPPRLETADGGAAVEAAAGSTATLACRAPASPRPLHTWTKDGAPLVYSDTVYLDENNDVVLTAVTEYDAGVYECTATNALGSARRSYTLLVVAPPSMMDTDEVPLEIEAVEGSLVELPCSARGLPRPHLEWRHDNRTLVPGPRRQIGDDFTLRFVANLTDFGEYQCTAVNKVGEASRTYFLFVWVSPYVDLPFEAAESQLGEAVTLRCDAVGFPVPTITWMFGNKALHGNSSGISYNDTGYVSIESVRGEHEGSYVCNAASRAGVAQKYIRLDVIQPPHIVGNASELVALNSDSEVIIPCAATGKPRPHILWSKDGAYITPDWRHDVRADGSLSVRPGQAGAGGDYTCEATNRLGRHSVTHRLHVYSAPKSIQMNESELEVVMVEGSNDSLHCNIQHSAEDTVRWYKEGELIASGELRLGNVSRGDAAQYACAASNAAGAAAAAVRLRVEWPPAPLAPPPAAELLEGGDHYLDCASDARPPGTTKWYFNLDRLPGGSEKIELRSVQPHHAGLYTCVVSNKHGVSRRTFNVTVLSPPRLQAESEVELDFRQGSYATLQCSPRGLPKPDVSWRYNNTDWSVQNGSLVCKNTSKRSEGHFQCVSRNKAGVATLLYRVNVLSPAVLKEIVVYVDGESTTVKDIAEIEAGKSVRISCSAEGSPKPKVQWNRNGRTVSWNDPGVYYSDLSIQDVQRSTEGPYVCIVANDAGRQERTIHLDVLKPSTAKQETIEVINGEPFRLHCHPYGNPLPSIYWFRDGALLRFYDDTLLTEEFGEVLVAGSSVYEQSGNYTCVARNKAGEDSVSYVLNVLVPPQSDSKDNSTIKVRAQEGMIVNLTCPSQGNPPPRIIWRKHPYTEITLKLFPKVSFEEDNSSMVITNATSEDSGKFTCSVANKVGTLEVTFEVVVESPPVILTNGATANDNIESVIVPLRRTVVLKCPVKGFPQPTITWLKDAVAVGGQTTRTPSGGALAVAAAAARDAGQYICVVDNAAGSAHRRYDVRVAVPGEWTAWSLWSLCNATCGHGVQWRHRLCHYVGDDGVRVVSGNVTSGNTTVVQPAGVVLDESACVGPALHTRPCYMPPCEEEEEVAAGEEDGARRRCAWSAWAEWGECDASCGVGAQARRRRCRCPPDGAAADCPGDDVQIRKCIGLPECQITYSGEHGTISQEQYLPEATYETESETNGHPGSVYRIDDNYSSEEDIGVDTNIHSVVCQNRTSCGRNPVWNESTDGASEDLCRAGFSVDPSTGLCEDVDECLLHTSVCHSTQLCENTAGGYRCFCQPGYSSLGAGQRCLDLNECELETHRCEYACVNTAGGYVCACPRPLRLRADGHSCADPRLFWTRSSVYKGEVLGHRAAGREIAVNANADDQEERYDDY